MDHLTKTFNHIKSFNWCDAFYKFGFGDGDGIVRTYDIAEFLRRQGYEVGIYDTGIHNKVINSIKIHGKEVLPVRDPAIRYGYDHPRRYLPVNITALLDKAFPLENALSENNYDLDV